MPFSRRPCRGFLPRRPARPTLAALPLLLPLLLLLAGCGSGGGSNPNQPPTGTGKLVGQPGWNVHTSTYALAPKKWTFLVYLNAANDLESFGTLNVNQMESVGSNSDVNVVVQWKRIDMGSQDSDTSNGNWTDTRRYYVTKDTDPNNVNSALISQSSNIDMGDPNTLQAFVQWGVAAYPAQHYCLVLWNHGAGWRAQQLTRAASGSAAAPPPGAPTRGFSYDDATGNHIDTTQLGQAIDISGTGQKWDVVTLDASLMQMAEVAYELRGRASYIVGSEESPPGEGLPYNSILGDLTASPDEAPLAFARQMAQEALNDYGTGSDTTQSVLDASQLAAVAPAVDALGSALTAAKGAWGTQISAARLHTEYYGHGYSAYTDYKDLTDFLDQLTAAQSNGQPLVNDAGVLSAAQAVRGALGAAIVFNANGSGHPRSHGLAVFLPTPADYAVIDSEQASGSGPGGGSLRYTSLSFAQAAPNWVNFIKNGPN